MNTDFVPPRPGLDSFLILPTLMASLRSPQGGLTSPRAYGALNRTDSKPHRQLECVAMVALLKNNGWFQRAAAGPVLS
jgi:hypothetical protein